MPQRGKYLAGAPMCDVQEQRVGLRLRPRLRLDPGNRLEPVVSEAHRRGPDTDRGHLFDKRARRGAGRGIMSDYEQHVCRVID